MAKRNTYALSQKNHPLSVGWRVDFDYTKQLTPEQKLWLSDFVDGYYSGDFGGEESSKLSTKDRRDSYTRKNVANADCYHGLENERLLTGLDAPLTGQKNNNLTRLIRGSERSNIQKVSDTIPSLPLAAEPVPAYLNSQEYKEALAQFRSTLNPTRRICKPKETPEYLAAQENLNKIISRNNHDY